MKEEEAKVVKNHDQQIPPPYYQYGTFQGVANYQPNPVTGIPYLVPPPFNHHYAHGYQTVPGHHPYAHAEPAPKGLTISVALRVGLPVVTVHTHRSSSYSIPFRSLLGYLSYVVAGGRPEHLPRLPCCGIGLGWFLFIFGCFFGIIPWYLGAFILFCLRSNDLREQAGYIAHTIAAVLAKFASMTGHHPQWIGIEWAKAILRVVNGVPN